MLDVSGGVRRADGAMIRRIIGIALHMWRLPDPWRDPNPGAGSAWCMSPAVFLMSPRAWVSVRAAGYFIGHSRERRTQIFENANSSLRAKANRGFLWAHRRRQRRPAKDPGGRRLVAANGAIGGGGDSQRLTGPAQRFPCSLSRPSHEEYFHAALATGPSGGSAVAARRTCDGATQGEARRIRRRG